jgi:phage I-like protein
MIQDTIGKIEAKLTTSEAIRPAHRSELLQLLGQLKTEIQGLEATDADAAERVAGFADISTHEATRTEKNPELLELSLKGLSKTVDEFEQSHPQLVAVVNRLSTVLANSGV